MNISERFIRRPVATTLLSIGLTFAGLLAYRALPVSALPQVEYPTIVVATMLPGASADTMASMVTGPLERQLGQVPALDQMTSISSFGTSRITLQFSLQRPIDAAEQDVQAAINAASNLLPATLPSPPTYSKINPADTPVLTLSLAAKSLPIRQVDDYADSILAQRISQVPGVGLVSLSGGQKPAVRVQVDPQALAGAGLTLEDVRQAIMVQNVNQPKGSLDGATQAYALATNDQLFAAKGFEPLILTRNGGGPIRLAQVAAVVDGVENTQLAAWAGAQQAIILSVQRQPGANLIEVVDRIYALLPGLRATLPPGMNMEVLADRTETVRASVDDVQLTLVLTTLLVILIIFIFLRNLWATLIAALAVPLSILATFCVMLALDYSLDNLSLMALTISTGFVVDDAIVMLENISRYIEAGEHPLQAAIRGAGEIGFTIVSLTLSLVAVLIPLLFMGGIIGRLFREFAVTLSAAIFASAALSLTLTPTMCAYLIRHQPAAAGRLSEGFEAAFAAVQAFYGRTLRDVLAHRRATLLGTAVTLLLTVVLAATAPKGFFPQQDTGLIAGTTQASADICFAAMRTKQAQLAALLIADPDVASVASAIGADGTNAAANSGRMTLALVPRAKRARGVQQIMADLQGQARQVEGLETFLQAVQDLQFDTRASRTQFQYTLEAPTRPELQEATRKLAARLGSLPQLQDVASDQQLLGLAADLQIDRDTASQLGVLPQAIDDTLYDAFGQRIISTIFTQLNQYRVILEVKPDFAADAASLSQIYVRSETATPVALAAFSSWKLVPTPLAVFHQGQFPAATLSFNLAPGAALGDAVQAIERAQAALALPKSVRASFVGTARAFAEALQNEPALVAAAIITVYIVLGILYESWIHPITILSTLPSAGVGAFMALRICGAPFDIIALIGMILLIGIVKKNAIMMIDFALEAERTRRIHPHEAIYQACLLRLRPIMMTTLAALFGGLPLALGWGTGSELRRPLGITIVGGIFISQILTLYTTPVVYLAMDKLGRALRKLTARTTPPTKLTAPHDLL